MSFYLLFYGLLLFFYDLLALTGYSSLVGLDYFKRVQQQIGRRRAHWLLQLVAISMITVGLSMRFIYS